MKWKLIILLGAISFLGMAQKKHVNGKIYDKHPAIEVVDKFTDAFVGGDEETIRNLVTEDFGWWAKNELRPQRKDVESLIRRSNYLSENVLGFELTNNGAAYTDAMEFGKDKTIHVYTYQLMKGFDKNTGMSLQMPRNSIFFMNDSGDKIAGIVVSDSQLKWQKAYDAWGVRKNGVIYKDHNQIAKGRLLYAYLATQDTVNMRALYHDNAQIRDVMSLNDLKDYRTPDEEMEMLRGFYDKYEIINVVEIGYPDLLDYDGDDTVTIISWWEMQIKNKTSGAMAKSYQHSQLVVNKDGLIVREDYYWNPALLPK